MKKSFNNTYNQLSTAEMVTLTTEVKETIAIGMQTVTKSFTAADLWNIQRQTRSRVQRRFL